MANKTSQHILNTSTNLLGFCLFVITSLHISNYAQTSKIDEFASVIALLLVTSSILSFFSIRTQNVKKEKLFEDIADYLFIVALVGVLVLVAFIVFNVVK